MNQLAIMELYAGGPGSGCQGPNCGRPKSGLQEMLEKAKAAWGPNNLWSKLAEYGHAGNTEPFSKEEIKQLKELTRYSGAASCKVGFCFENAQKIATASNVKQDNRVQLVEGLITVHGVPIDHSWIEYNGKVYDPTLARYAAGKEPDYSKGGTKASIPMPDYFGVIVPKNEILGHQLRTKMYNPLSHSWENEKLQAKIWKK